MVETNDSENQIPERIAELLSPISGDSPTGGEATSSEEYFKLDMEIGKVSPDYKTCVDLATEILTGISKNLRVASWMCLAWYRTEGLPGLRDGIHLLLELLKTFEADLFPQKPAHRSKAIHFVDTSRFVKLVEREEVDSSNAPIFLETETLLKELAAEGAKQFPENVPDFKDLGKVLAAHADEAKALAKEASGAKEPADKPTEEGKEPASPVKPSAPERMSRKSSSQPAVPIQDIALGSGQEVLVAFIKLLVSFFKLEEEDRKHEAYIYGISRALVWTKMVVPPHENSVTQISAPDAAIINTFQKWLAEKNWTKLIPAIELNFLTEDSGFKYWITAQRYLAQALEQLGGPALGVAEEIMFQTARLLQRFPNLPQMKFKNKLAFADDETLLWIEDQVAARLGSGSGKEMLLPPILGEEYDGITEDYKKVCSELPDNFESNMDTLEKSLAGETRRKGRFLRMLNLANFCFQAKKFELAKVHLTKLFEKIETFQLAEWEPALCTGVWESMYLANLKLLTFEKDQGRIDSLETQQEDLFKKIALYNGVLALKLASRTQNKGE